jgi:hypothetical protein
MPQGSRHHIPRQLGHAGGRLELPLPHPDHIIRGRRPGFHAARSLATAQQHRKPRHLTGSRSSTKTVTTSDPKSQQPRTARIEPTNPGPPPQSLLCQERAGPKKHPHAPLADALPRTNSCTVARPSTRSNERNHSRQKDEHTDPPGPDRALPSLDLAHGQAPNHRPHGAHRRPKYCPCSHHDRCLCRRYPGPPPWRPTPPPAARHPGRRATLAEDPRARGRKARRRRLPPSFARRCLLAAARGAKEEKGVRRGGDGVRPCRPPGATRTPGPAPISPEVSV